MNRDKKTVLAWIVQELITILISKNYGKKRNEPIQNRKNKSKRRGKICNRMREIPRVKDGIQNKRNRRRLHCKHDGLGYVSNHCRTTERTYRRKKSKRNEAQMERKELEQIVAHCGFVDLSLPAEINLIDEINRLKKEKNAVILGHYYITPNLQNIS